MVEQVRWAPHWLWPEHTAPAAFVTAQTLVLQNRPAPHSSWLAGAQVAPTAFCATQVPLVFGIEVPRQNNPVWQFQLNQQLCPAVDDALQEPRPL